MSARSVNILTDLSQTIGTLSIPIVSATLLNQPSGAQIRPNALYIHNASATAAIAVNLTGGAAVINGAGSMTLNPGGYLLLDTALPTNNINAIAASASTPITVYIMQ